MRSLCVTLVLSLAGTLSAQEEAKPVEVTSARRVEGFARKFAFTGAVTSPRRANLSSRTEGLVAGVAVDAGVRSERAMCS